MPAEYLINGSAPADLGVRLARRELQSMDVSRVILEVVDENLVSPALFTFGTEVVVQRNGAVWFRGKVYKPTQSVSGASYSQTIEIRDAWEDLKQIAAEQAPDSGNPDTHTTIVTLGGATMVATTDVMGDAPDAGEESIRIVGDLAAAGICAVGDIQNGMPTVSHSLRNPTTAEVLNDLATTSPGQVGWFNYASSPPQLNLRVIGNSSPVVVLDFQEGYILSARISPRFDLLLNEVNINFIDQSSGAAATASTQQATGGAAGTLRKLSISHELPSGSKWDDAGGGTFIDASTGLANAPIPAGYAAAILAAYAHEFFEGEVTIKDDDLDGTDFMGAALVLQGAKDAWANMRVPIIAVSTDCLSGETTITIGPNRRSDPKGSRGQSPIAPAFTPDTNPDPSSTAEEPAHDPLETYVAVGTNIIKVAPGLCGLDEDLLDNEVDGTAPDTVATIGLGGTVNVYLGVSFAPDVDAFSVVDDDGASSTEYRPTGTGTVLTATIRTSRATPAPQPAVVNYTTGAVTQNGVFYFKLAEVTWPGGDAPVVQVLRKGNFDLINIPPNRCYLRVQEA